MSANKKQIGEIFLDGDCFVIHKSLMDAARATGIKQGNITNCLKGRCKTVGGFKWERV